MSLMELQHEKSERVYTRRQTSAEIVSEARRSLRSLTTQRPFTPQEQHRQLFGESSSRARDGRPPSAFSLHARNFEAPDSRPGSGSRLSPLEHIPRLSAFRDEDGREEEAALPKPPAERENTRRGSGGCRARHLRTSSINKLPLMTSQSKSLDRSVEERIDQPEDGERLHCDDVTGHITKASSEAVLHTINKNSRIAQSAQNDVSFGSKPDAYHGLNDTDADDNMDESHYWNSKVLPLLHEIESFAPGDGVSEEMVGRMCHACTELHNALAERGMLGRQCKKRSTILRSLFRLVDVGSDRLNLTLAKLILALNVSGNNLVNICKLIFKISRNASNDTLFLTSSVLDSLLSLLKSEDVWSKSEAVLYCVGSLKLLSGNSALASLLLGKDFIGILLLLSKRLRHCIPQTSSNVTNHRAEGQNVIAGHILVQVTAALRNIADQSESRPSFLSSKAFVTLCWIVENHRHDTDICINVARIFSKLSTYTECCYALAETPRCCSLFLDLLGKHSRKQDLVVRLLFTLGNLTAKSIKARERVYEEEGGIDALLDLFQIYQRKPSAPEQHPAPEREDVLIKLIRLLANLAIHPTVGTALAANPLCVQLLLQVLESRCVQECEELVINAAATINNLSFYQGESSLVRSQYKHISQLLLKLLLGSSMEGVLEATRVFGNLSQIKDVRRFIVQHKVHQFVVTLLDSKNPDVCFSACGVLINLSADSENTALLRVEGTTQKLIDCLRDFGSQDWHLAAVVCQTLWNCSLDGEMQHSEELLKILRLYTDRELLQWPSNDGVRQVQEACWELLFLPVAERLRQRLHVEDITGIS